jgi:hypothetical protein
VVLTGEGGREWQDVSGRFGKGEGAVLAGVAIFDHPGNPGYPAAFSEGKGIIQPAIASGGPLVLPAGKPATFRYRVFVHRGRVDRKVLAEEFRAWAASMP